MKEEWKTITYFERYEISNRGVVRNKKTGRIMKTSISQEGYEQTVLRRNNKSYSKRIHRMVIEEFNPTENMQLLNVIHKDGNKLNNSIDNLEWISANVSKHHPIGGNEMRTLHMYVYHAIKSAINQWQKETNVNIDNLELYDRESDNQPV